MAERTPFHEREAQEGATFAEHAGWLVPEQYGDPASEYRLAREATALFDLSPRGKVEMTGKDAKLFLHNLCSNEVAKLPAGAGCEAFLATLKAKVVAHIIVYLVGDSLWLDVAPGMADKLIQHLDHFLISEQVAFTDHTRTHAQLHLAGPLAKKTLELALHDTLPGRQDLGVVERTFGSAGLVQIRGHDYLGVPGYDIVCSASASDDAWKMLLDAGANPAGRATHEILRVEAGAPEFGIDIDENNLVMEVGRTKQAVCYTKGCFLGQEPIVRARDLGHVNRCLLGLALPGTTILPRGYKLLVAGQEVGQITSSVYSPRFGQTLALAYIRRMHAPGAILELDLDGEKRIGRVMSLPFELTVLS